MTSVSVIGGGAFGTALALCLARDETEIGFWCRDIAEAAKMRDTRKTGARLPGLELPASIHVSDAIPTADVALIAIPTQSLRSFLSAHKDQLGGVTLISCAKGVELGTGLGSVEIIRDFLPDATAGCLTGPSFAVDIAKGLPTALVLALQGDAQEVQSALNRPTLRVYRTSDVAGAQLGGALKNVIALAAGMAIGAGFGDSARAAVIARGFAEMTRYATRNGARAETLQGLSGLGDLVLTCTSEKSRNFAAGIRLGQGAAQDAGVTVEGLATAAALCEQVADASQTLPITSAVHAVASGQVAVSDAVTALLSRPVHEE